MIRHTPFEGIAGFREPVEAAGYEITRVDVSQPEFADIDFLSPDLILVMGGPMGVYERDANPWIDGEIARLCVRIAADRPTIGVCLGSQMLAAALGARVYPGPVREVGFAPVEMTAAGVKSPLRHLVDTPILHWHGDTFDLPEGCTLLASTSAYPHQAYQRGPNLLALQCHPEMGEDERFEIWLEDAEYIESAGISVDALRSDHDRLGSRAVVAGRAMIRDWLAQLD